jgi:hypothetical protein
MVGKNYPTTLRLGIKKSIDNYNLVKKSLEEGGIDISVFEERFNEMKKEYNYTE